MNFIKELRKRFFPFLVALSALSVSASAAFYSVSGLSKLFAGASLEVFIMASSLEVSKLIIASLLYQYWDTINKILRFYLTLAATVLVLITSMGIYGFLSAAYQETATKSGIVDKEINVIDLKRERFIENRDYLLEEKKTLDGSINSLRDGLANNVIQYKDSETGEIITTTSSSTRKALQGQLDDALTRRDNVSSKLEAVTDSISTLDIKILEIESNSDLAAELGPLKYLSELTEMPMGDIVNYLLLIIVFVFDPLAISLVIAANFLFSRLNKDEEDEVEIIKESNDLIDNIVTLESDGNTSEDDILIKEEAQDEIIEEKIEQEDSIEDTKEETVEDVVDVKNKRLVYKKRNG